MKKTLVIHPQDASTDFLKFIYADKKDWTIVNSCEISRQDLYKLVEDHDRIIMMGHGCSSGLFNPQKYGLLIDRTFANLFKNKETISIWCHSDGFFRPLGLKGFHTGMIISEVAEAKFVLGTTPLSKEETLDNMEKFAKIINKCIDEEPHKMQDYILKHYNFKDKVTQYNRRNIIVID